MINGTPTAGIISSSMFRPLVFWQCLNLPSAPYLQGLCTYPDPAYQAQAQPSCGLTCGFCSKDSSCNDTLGATECADARDKGECTLSTDPRYACLQADAKLAAADVNIWQPTVPALSQ
jgi:hypothetical protein